MLTKLLEDGRTGGAAGLVNAVVCIGDVPSARVDLLVDLLDGTRTEQLEIPEPKKVKSSNNESSLSVGIYLLNVLAKYLTLLSYVS